MDKIQEKIDKISKQFRGKKIMLYGAGQFARVLFENYDLSKLNITGIADKKFEDDKVKEFYSYKPVFPKKIHFEDFDVILFLIKKSKAVRNYFKYVYLWDKDVSYVEFFDNNTELVDGKRFVVKKSNFDRLSIKDKLSNFFFSRDKKLDFIIEQNQALIQLLHDNIGKFNLRTDIINQGITKTFQYMTGIELNNQFGLEREVIFEPKRAPIDHYNCYMFAKDNINENDRVADIACACGYGSSILSQKAKSVIGVDINQPVIDFANKVYKKDNLEFYCQDAQDLKLENKLDAVVSFETIEHIEYPELFLNKINLLLNAGGKLICSVPNETTRPWARENNEFHYRHYTKEQLAELLNSCGFEVQDIYQQYVEGKFKVEQREYEGSMIICVATKRATQN